MSKVKVGKSERQMIHSLIELHSKRKMSKGSWQIVDWLVKFRFKFKVIEGGGEVVSCFCSCNNEAREGGWEIINNDKLQFVVYVEIGKR